MAERGESVEVNVSSMLPLLLIIILRRKIPSKRFVRLGHLNLLWRRGGDWNRFLIKRMHEINLNEKRTNLTIGNGRKGQEYL